MDLRRPMRVVTPTLDGEVLAALASGDVRMTGRELGRHIEASQEGVRRVLERLERQGIVLREKIGNAYLYRLNREHLAAPHLAALAALRLELFSRLKQAIAGWQLPPVAATIFGSTARDDSDESSDIDLLVLRPATVDGDDPTWRRQLAELQRLTTALTGNDARLLELSDDDPRDRIAATQVVADASADGIDLYGSLSQWRARRLARLGRWRRTRARRRKDAR